MPTASTSPPYRRFLGVALLAVVVGLLFAAQRWASHGRQPLVVYCAHDAEYAQKVLDQFEHDTGIPLSIRYDTEATKSLSLVELLVREKDHPRCDVFWNNQIEGLQELEDADVLDPYQGPGFARIPAGYKDPVGRWTGFAARLRLYIINTKALKPDESAVQQALSGDLSRVAIAKPLYGSTFTQYAVLWSEWGPERLKAWHADWRKRGVIEVAGNSDVKSQVANGTCDLGFTDIDDFYEAKDAGAAVAMLPVRLDTGQVICIPNTISIIKGSTRLDDARRLADYLLSAQSEVRLANSGSRQIPLGPVDDAQLPPEVKQLRQWAQNAYPLDKLGDAPGQCLAWLKWEYLK